MNKQFKSAMIWLFIGTLIITIINYSNFIQFTKLKAIKIIGNNFLKENEIRQHLNFLEDQNLLTLDIDEIQASLQKKEFLKSCRISRIFPSTLLVEIIENEPIAILNSANEKLILDSDGTKLSFNEKAFRFFSLPVIQINKYSIFEKNKNGVAAVSDILTKIKLDYPEIFTDIRSFDFNGTGDVIIKFDRKTKIFVHELYLNDHFRYLDEFRKTQSLHHVLSNYQTIDLRVDNQIIVKKNT